MNKFAFRINRNKIIADYKTGRLEKNEFLLLHSLASDEFEYYIVGRQGYIIDNPEKNSDSYFTDASKMLEAVYKVHRRHPSWHLDKMFNEDLYKLSSQFGLTYQVLSVIEQQVKNEHEGIAPFKINAVYILKNMKNSIMENKEYFEQVKRHGGAKKQNGLWGIFEDYNESFKSILNYDLFDNAEGTPQKK